LAAKLNKNKVIATAQKLVQKGQYEKAIREYQKVVEDDPLEVRIWLKIGDLHAKLNQRSEAIDTYGKVAEFYSEQGFYLKAVAVYKQVMRIDTDRVDVNLRLAELYKQLGLLNDAMQQYEQVSNFYHRGGRTREALAALRQIVELDPKNVASRIKLAELYSREQMRDEAVEEFSRAADFLRAENRSDELLKVCERLIFHQPNNTAVIKELSGIYLQQGDPRRSLQKLQMAFKVDPRDEETLDMLARAFQALGQAPKAVSVLKELARVYAETGETFKQQEVYRRVLALEPGDRGAQQALGMLEASSPAAPMPGEQHRFQESPFPGPPPERLEPREAYELEVEPGALVIASDPAPSGSGASALPADLDTEVVKIITEAEVYIKYGLQDKAIEHLQKVFKRDPQNQEVRLKLRDIYVQLGQPRQAARELYLLARTVQDPPAAAGYLNEALDLEPELDEARQLLAQLESGVIPLTTRKGESVEALEADDIIEELDIDAEDIVVEDEEEDGEWVDMDDLGPALDAAPEAPDPAALIQDDLEEAEFFIQQSLYSEAEAILEELLARFPDHPLLKAKHAELEMIREEEAERVTTSPRMIHQVPPDNRLAAELAEEVRDVSSPGVLAAELEGDVSVEAMFAELKAAEAPVSDEDAETHYDLGIAYREMGLMEDAINAFIIAMRARDKQVSCFMMIGLCEMDRGAHSEAISQFKKGLYVEGIKPREAISLYFELGRAYEQMGDNREAIYYYDKVAKKDPRFRDVTTRIAQLGRSGSNDLGTSV
jgi:tetratricopeptide (TPR) repeat protein